jgi:hypothetical protein
MEALVRGHQRWIVGLAGAFLLSALLSLPFFAGMPWHAHWKEIGEPVLTVCLILWLALLFEAGMTWVFWSCVRDVRRVERMYVDRTQRIDKSH